jgi:hypothetical protein
MGRASLPVLRTSLSSTRRGLFSGIRPVALSALARERPEEQTRAQAHLPPVPKGFQLHPRPAWGFARNDLAYRVADTRRGALSLVAETRDLSGLATLGEEDLWLLDLRDLPVRNTDLSLITRFRRLLVLLLTGCPVTDTDVGVVAAVSSLETLHLNETRVTDAGLTALEAHPALAVLDIRSTPVRGEGVRHLAGVPNLRELRVTGAARRSALEVFRQRPQVDVL